MFSYNKNITFPILMSVKPVEAGLGSLPKLIQVNDLGLLMGLPEHPSPLMVAIAAP